MRKQMLMKKSDYWHIKVIPIAYLTAFQPEKAKFSRGLTYFAKIKLTNNRYQCIFSESLEWRTLSEQMKAVCGVPSIPSEFGLNRHSA